MHLKPGMRDVFLERHPAKCKASADEQKKHGLISD